MLFQLPVQDGRAAQTAEANGEIENFFFFYLLSSVKLIFILLK